MSKLHAIEAAIDDVARGHYFHPFTSIAEQQAQGPHVMTSAEGIRIRDRSGNDYIDAMAGLWCVNVGYSRRELVEAMTKQAETLPYYHSFMGAGNEPAIRLAGALAELTPGRLQRVFFGNSGSDANDTHVKLLWYYNNLLGKPEKKKIIARQGAYHGVTVATASMSGLPHLHERFDLPLERFLHVKRPHYYWDAPEGMPEREFSAYLAKDLEDRILAEGPETVAAFVAEPVQGAGAVIVPPEGYFDAIVPILRKYDIKFLADEVICGFGRLGAMFGSSYFGIEPDLMTVAKGLTSGYIPLSASIVSEDMWEVLEEASAEKGMFSHGFTYTGHPLACAVGLANLAVIQEHNLVQNAADTGAYLHERLEAEFGEHPLVGEKRGVGLIAALELVADKDTKTPFDLSLDMGRRLYWKLLEQGLICRPIKNSLCFSPPLVLTPRDADEIVEKFGRGLQHLTDELVREGTWSG